MVAANIQRDSGSEAFYQYLNDITGIIESIDIHQAFEVMAELITTDLERLFQVHFSDYEKIRMYFKSQEFMKIFCKLTYALVNDINRKLFFETHTKIPLLIHKLVGPVLEVLTTAEHGFF